MWERQPNVQGSDRVSLFGTDYAYGQFWVTFQLSDSGGGGCGPVKCVGPTQNSFTISNPFSLTMAIFGLSTACQISSATNTGSYEIDYNFTLLDQTQLAVAGQKIIKLYSGGIGEFANFFVGGYTPQLSWTLTVNYGDNYALFFGPYTWVYGGGQAGFVVNDCYNNGRGVQTYNVTVYG